MSRLQALLDRYRDARLTGFEPFPSDVWTWTGTTPQTTAPLFDIVAPLGYDEAAAAKFLPVAKEDAALWLAMLAIDDLMHGPGNPRPAQESVSEVLEALHDFDPSMQFFSNGRYQFARGKSIYWETAHANGEWTKAKPNRCMVVFVREVFPVGPSMVVPDSVAAPNAYVDAVIVGLGDKNAFSLCLVGVD